MKYLFCVVCFILSLEASEFEKSINIVTDTKHNVMWQDNQEVTEYLETFTTAEVYCETMVLNGYTDWRVPSIYELISIIDVNENNAINKKFKFINPNIYNTNTTFLENDEDFMTVDFSSGIILKEKKMNENYIRCIRDII